jgi:hypothetical protein
MKKENIIPLAGIATSSALSWAVIHFWLAEWYSAVTGLSRSAAYLYLVTILVLFQLYRIRLVLKGQDFVTNMIKRWRAK